MAAPDPNQQHEETKPQILNEKEQGENPSAADGSVNKVNKQEQDGSAPQTESGEGDKPKDSPKGGYDSTPIPRPPTGTIGYTLRFKFHKATNLAIGDLHVMSSDPYCLAQLNTGLPQRHKEDPKLRWRTPTVRRNTDPTWDDEWIVANVPSTGFKLKVRIYDEDPADHDDMLGKVHITVDSLSDNWPGIKNQAYKLTVRDSSKRALLIRAVARCFGQVKRFQGELYVSIEMIGRTESDDSQKGKAYTVGPCRWCRHYSPLLGRLTHTKDFSDTARPPSTGAQDARSKSIQKYNFQANEIQLAGPVPADLYHRFVEFKPWVKRMFTLTGFQGVILGKALHHQHNRVYNYGRTTLWGSFPEGPSIEMTKKFLELVHYDQGGRIFTYVLTLDGLWRFTETGKEFGIDMLSKHTMHSDVSMYIAFSGEFFIRRLKHRRRPPPPDPIESSSQQSPPAHEPNDIEPNSEEDPPTDPALYELIIDNDSGTYRPNAKMLPALAAYLSECLPGLHIMTLDSQGDAEKMGKMKDEQRERKKREGDNIVYAQGDDSSISSSEDERLNDIEAGVGAEFRPAPNYATGDGSAKERGTIDALTRDAKLHGRAHLDKFQRNYHGSSRNDSGQEAGAS